MKNLKPLFSFSGFDFFLKNLKKREKLLLSLFTFLFSFSFSFSVLKIYYEFTKEIPVKGGHLILAEVGFPTLLNPLYSFSSPLNDEITEFLFAGLMKYEKGKIVPELIKEWTTKENGKIYEIILKDNIFWSDGKEISADDVIFTVNSIQNPEVKSPLRALWLGVEMEKISEKAVRFKLKNQSGVFLENLTLKIIPKHAWENVSPANFPFYHLNFEPIGSGPYKLKELLRDKEGRIISLVLIPNEKYFGQKPFISKITYLFFENKEKLKGAIEKNIINAFSMSQPENFPNFLFFEFEMPRYYAVFFNLEKKIFSKEVREALNFATDKREILEKAFSKGGKIINSPLLPKIFGLKEPTLTYNFDLEKAKEILKKANFEDLDGDQILEKVEKKEIAFEFKKDLKMGSRGKEVEELQKCLAKFPEIYPQGEITGYFGKTTKEAVILFQEKFKEEILKPQGLEKGTGEVKGKTREKLNEVCFERKEEKIILKFSLVTVNESPLIETAQILKEQWKKIGVEVEIKPVKIETLEREIIPNKNYDAILFGQALKAILDPFPFWHSFQKGEMGLNLSNYENEKADEKLAKARQTLDEEERKKLLEEFQEILISDAPAVFLISPYHFYFVSEKVKGIEKELLFTEGQKFNNIEKWYLKTKRVLK